MGRTNASRANVAEKQGDDDAGRYFRYMAEFIGFTAADADAIRRTHQLIERHVPDIVAGFYDHLLRYPPTRRFFLGPDGKVDRAYVELRMRHLTNFWLRTASGDYGDDYARYVDYVGRAHTSRGADPKIYIAERYVIGQVGFVQHAISALLMQELRGVDEALEAIAVEAWDKLMMVILELLSRAYGNEREAETFDPLVQVDRAEVDRLAREAFARERDAAPAASREVVVARAADIPNGERRLVTVGELSIGVFHQGGRWHAVRNSCLHRGGPVATGPLQGRTLICPWHGFKYDLETGCLLVDPSARLDTYPVTVVGGEVRIRVPVEAAESAAPSAERPAPQPAPDGAFRVDDLAPGQVKLVQFRGRNVAVYNVGGALYATADECTHEDGPLSEGDLQGDRITCPWHGSCFDVRTGAVVCGPADRPVQTYQVDVSEGLARLSVAPAPQHG